MPDDKVQRILVDLIRRLDTVTRPAVLFATTVASTIEAFLLPLAIALRDAGWRVEALAAGASDNATIAPFFDHVHDAAWSRSITDPGNFLGTPVAVRGLVESRDFDVVHVHTPIASFVTRYALRSRTPGHPTVIYTAHGFHFFVGGSPLTNALYRTAEKAAARWTDQLVTINREDYDAARRLGTIPPDRVHYIPGVGVDPAAYRAPSSTGAALRDRLGIPHEAMVITMIAEMNANKRHSLAIDALAQMTEDRAYLLLVGDGPLRADLESRARHAGVAGRVRFVGQRTDVPAILSATDVLTLVSVREGLPRVVLEALSARIPVVSTRTRGVTDILSQGGGWLVDDADPALLASAFDRAANHPDEARERGRQGARIVESGYTLDHVIPCYLDLYHSAVTT